MDTPPTFERRIVMPLLALQAGAAAVIAVVSRGRPAELTLLLIGAALAWGSLLAYARGWERARHLAALSLSLVLGLGLQEPYLSERFSLTIFVPPAMALLISTPAAVIFGALGTYLLLVARAGWQSVYLEPDVVAIGVVIVGSMALARLLAEASHRALLAQHAESERERLSLAERVAERTVALETANAELVRASQLKDAFLANVSHELRTPINVVLGNLGLLQEGVYGPLTERQRQSLDTMAESGQSLLNLINDLLDLAKIEAGRLAFAYVDVSVREVCDNCLSLIGQQAARKGLELRFDFDPAVGHIRSDPRRLRQILLGLLSNAVKFTPPGRAIGLEVRAAAGGWVELVVWDEGVGIAPEDLERLFQPFTQLDQGLARQYEGTGLGLTLVRQLAALHGGEVDVQSRPGAGSRFRVRLPVHPDEQPRGW